MTQIVKRRRFGGAAWWGGAALALASVVLWPAASAYASATLSFGYTGGEQDWTVPAGVTSVTIQAFGAQGGHEFGRGDGGEGGSTTATIPVTPGETLAVFVGGQGAESIQVALGEEGGAGGFNGGGSGGGADGGGGGGGGGASDVRQGGTDLSDRVVVAGGGGGGGGGEANGNDGGAGGGTAGAAGGGSPRSTVGAAGSRPRAPRLPGRGAEFPTAPLPTEWR